jgi:hypothetical protein
MSSVGAGLRLLRAGWIMVREGVVAALPGDQLSGLPKFGWRVARLFTKRKAIRRGRSERLPARSPARPSYVKLGQFLATGRTSWEPLPLDLACCRSDGTSKAEAWRPSKVRSGDRSASARASAPRPGRTSAPGDGRATARS